MGLGGSPYWRKMVKMDLELPSGRFASVRELFFSLYLFEKMLRFLSQARNEAGW
ncbi:MAG: hypothetical protein PWQ67_11 [Clostridia bacterium]|jgi:hypothetical protein|nr:hypothetical protein [Clostridia bacterium]MDN5321557.1 hypothetical protein [Clostridia bacterium]